MPHALVSIGSNLGDRPAIVSAALAAIHSSLGVELLELGTSEFRETRPIGGPRGQDLFLNATALLETSLAPVELLARLQRIEYHLGRVRGEQRWAPRTLDLDLLLYDDLVLNTPYLTLPHPRMAFRRFVLAPAVDVAPDMVHPRIGWSIRRLWEHLNTTHPYAAIVGTHGEHHLALAKEVAKQTSARLLHGSRKDTGRARLEEHIQLLSMEARPYDLPAVLTTFWFDQLQIDASQTLCRDELVEFERAWRAARPKVVKPRLVLWLDASNDWLAAQSKQPLDRECLDRYREATLKQLEHGDCGPWLRLDAQDMKDAVEEATAAIEAML